MNCIKINAKCFSYIWGGNKLREYGFESDLENIAEAWIFSFNEKGLSFTDGNYPISDVLKENELGKKYSNFPFFPFLIKFINSNDNLSIQVHPSDEYALKNENSFGKTEMWYILDSEKDAFLYLGLNDTYTPEQIRNAIENNTICDYLNKVPVKKGDCYFVESGTIHAIGKGITLIEIQQNSTLTYRLYDFDRVDKNGNKRELHVEKALKVINFNKFTPENKHNNPLGLSKYFYVNKFENENEIISSTDAGIVVSFVEGSGTIENMNFKKGDTFFIKANKKVAVSGNYTAITTTLKD